MPILLAALGPKMLDLAGSTTAGTSLGSSGPKTIATHVRPRISNAAERAGRPAPRIMALVVVSVTDRPDELRSEARASSELYDTLPAYRRLLDIEGVESGAELSLFGDPEQIVDGLQRYVHAGATDLRVIFAGNDDEVAATRAFFAGLLR